MVAFWVCYVLLIPLSRVRSEDISESITESSKNAEETTTFKIELFPANSHYVGQTRMPRKFFPKLHSGVAFIGGLKLGAILSKKGFELGHGKIASSHSFQIFGKPVNSAMSLSYGNVAPLLPLVNDDSNVSQNDDPTRNLIKKGIYQFTVIENPSDQSLEKLHSLCGTDDKNNQKENEDIDKINEDVVTLVTSQVEALKAEDEKAFLEEHDKRVKEINANILRRTNSKFQTR